MNEWIAQFVIYVGPVAQSSVKDNPGLFLSLTKD